AGAGGGADAAAADGAGLGAGLGAGAGGGFMASLDLGGTALTSAFGDRSIPTASSGTATPTKTSRARMTVTRRRGTRTVAGRGPPWAATVIVVPTNDGPGASISSTIVGSRVTSPNCPSAITNDRVSSVVTMPVAAWSASRNSSAF